MYMLTHTNSVLPSKKKGEGHVLTHTNSVLPSRKEGEGTCAYTANSTDISAFE